MYTHNSHNPIIDDFDTTNINNANQIEVTETPESIKRIECQIQSRNNILRGCYIHDLHKNENIIKNANGNIREIFANIELDSIHSCYIIVKYLKDLVIGNIKRFCSNPYPQYNIMFYNVARDLFIDLIYGANYAEKTYIQSFFQRMPKTRNEVITNNYINECTERAFNKIKQEYNNIHINQILINKTFAYDVVLTPFDIADSVFKINHDIKLHITQFFSSLSNILVYIHRLFENVESEIMKDGIEKAINKNIRIIKDFVNRIEKLENDITISYDFNSLDRDDYFGMKIMQQ